MNQNYILKKSIDTILTDIEGTTTSISFVKDVLFPYIRSNLRKYLIDNFDTEQCREDLKLLIDQSKSDFVSLGDKVPKIKENFSNKTELIESVIENIEWQMNNDRKAKPLKQLQGHMWNHAYKNGLVKGHVYDDVVPCFEEWILKGLKIYIYSSGSVEAQKLLFGYSEKGNLLKYFSGYFDTEVGQKINPQSYLNILNALGKSPEQVLFLTDLIREAEAASLVGINVCVLRREDNPDNEKKEFNCVNSFDKIKISF